MKIDYICKLTMTRRLYNPVRGLLVVLLLMSASVLQAQNCGITAPAVLCEGESANFKLVNNTTNSVTGYSWDFGDGTTSTLPNPNRLYVLPPGNSASRFNYSVTVTFSDGTNCTATGSITVNRKPQPNFSVPPPYKQCVEANLFTFTDLTIPTKDINGNDVPIVSWRWNFGDGTTANTQNTSHTFDAPGTYQVALSVTDANGCVGTFAQPLNIIVLEALKVNYNVKKNFKDCDTTFFTFTPNIDTTGSEVDEFLWIIGGERISGTKGNAAAWNEYIFGSFVRKFKKKGTYTAELFLFNHDQKCTTSLVSTLIVEEIILNLSYPDPTCFQGNNVEFTMDTIESAVNPTWIFDDPISGPRNVAFGWKASHAFTAARDFAVRFTAQLPDCNDSLLDTCFQVNILGPVASITLNPPPPPIPPNTIRTLIPRETKDFYTVRAYSAIAGDTAEIKVGLNSPYYFNYRLNSGKDSIFGPGRCVADTFMYSYFDTVYNGAGQPVYDYQYKITYGSIDSTIQDTTIYCADTNWWDIHPVGFTYNSITSTKVDSSVRLIETTDTFRPGDVLPTNRPIFYPTTGTANWSLMHDSDLNDENIKNFVRFTNLTRKYRGQIAIDDDAVPISTQYPDVENFNGHTFYPFATDSLLYLWQFQDPDGLPCTSTVANPDPKCNFSTEVVPYHDYDYDDPREDRCIRVQLRVIDTVVGCESSSTVNLRHGQPSAWWDTTLLNCVSFEYHNVINRNEWEIGNPSRPRRGFMLVSNVGFATCADGGNIFRYEINIDELLPSNCAPIQNYWITFDSAASTRYVDANPNLAGVQYCIYKTPDPSYPSFDPLDSNTWRVDTLKDHGFEGSTNELGWQVGAPKAVWENPLSWNGEYWWSPLESGCKTVGVVIQNGAAFDTGWYHNYYCIQPLNARFRMYSADYIVKNRDSVYVQDTIRNDSVLIPGRATNYSFSRYLTRSDTNWLTAC